MGRLSGKVAVITGAASGMGQATSLRFAGEGASVVVVDLNKEGGEATVRGCKENGGHAVFQRADVSSEADVQAMIARAVKEFGRLDITYNNAGIGGAVGPTRADQSGRLGSHPGGAAQGRFPRHQAFGA